MCSFLSSLLDFTENRPVWLVLTVLILKIYINLIMPKLVYLMTMQEAHNCLIDQIRAKYELLDSLECGAVGTTVFSAESSKLAHLFAHISKLCRHLNL